MIQIYIYIHIIINMFVYIKIQRAYNRIQQAKTMIKVLYGPRMGIHQAFNGWTIPKKEIIMEKITGENGKNPWKSLGNHWENR